MQTTSKLFFSFLFCFALTLLSGCGVSLTPAEQVEVDPYITEHARAAIPYYLMEAKNTDEKEIIKHLKYFVSKGADVNARTTGYHLCTTPLHCAVNNGNFEVVKFLVSRGADVNAKKDDGTTPLFGVTSVEIAKLLVSKGADVNATNKAGLTPLDIANGFVDTAVLGIIRTGKTNLEVVKYLESRSAKASHPVTSNE